MIMSCPTPRLSLPDPDGEQSALGSSGRHEPMSSGLPQTLQQEFSLVNLQIRNVNVEVGVNGRSWRRWIHTNHQMIMDHVLVPLKTIDR